MALVGRRSKSLVASAAVVSNSSPGKSLVASAIRTNISDLSYNLWKFRDEGWQRELWRFYDIIPEFGFAARWVGQCCSKVRIYVAKVDELGRVQGEVKDPKINALADSLLGGPAAKAEALRALGINLTVAGECYIVGRPGKNETVPSAAAKDEWYVLSSSEMRRVQSSNGVWQWAWYLPDGNPFQLDLDHNVITRVWTPHPQRVWCAESPARACQMILRELEQLTKYIFSQIDSRLMGAGLLIMPKDVDLPAEPNTTNASESLMFRLASAASQSLRGEGSALGVLPHMVESDNAEGWKLLSFESELSKTAPDLRREAVNRLGVGLDMPAEVLSGLGSENHWNAFLIDGYGIKVHIEPLMNRICDALTKAYLAPALHLMGKDPARYVYSYDTSPLSLRPQRLQDAMNLYDKGLLSGEAVREAGYFKDSEAAGVQEDNERFLREMLLRDPQLLQNQAIREAAGISEDLVPQSAMIAPTPESVGLGAPGGAPAGIGVGAGPPPPPAPMPEGNQTTLPPVIPDTLGKATQGFQMPPTGVGSNSNYGGFSPPGLTASATTQRQMEEFGVAVAADAAVRRGMELAGKRLLDKNTRNHFPDVPACDLHTRIKVQDQARATRLLLGAWDQLDPMVKFVAPNFDAQRLKLSLEKYCTLLLLSGTQHDPQQLLARLRADGVISA